MWRPVVVASGERVNARVCLVLVVYYGAVRVVKWRFHMRCRALVHPKRCYLQKGCSFQSEKKKKKERQRDRKGKDKI
jgi:hypothetical protein